MTEEVESRQQIRGKQDIADYVTLDNLGLDLKLHLKFMEPRSSINDSSSSHISSHILAKMANGWSIIIGLIVVVAASGVAWFLSPKGETQTIWRSSLILSFASCYIMWAITFLAQWHPLIVPRRQGLRTGAIHE